MSKRAGSLLMVLGLLLLLSAAAIAGYNIWDSNRAAESSLPAVQGTPHCAAADGTDSGS